MSIGSKHYIVGILHTSPLGYELQECNGGVWELEFGLFSRPSRFIGRRISIEGRRAGFNLIEVDGFAFARGAN